MLITIIIIIIIIIINIIIIILFPYYFCLIFIILIVCQGSGWFREDFVGFRVVPGRFRGVPGGSGRFRLGSGWFREVPARFRVVPGGSGRFRVGSAFYIHPKNAKLFSIIWSCQKHFFKNKANIDVSHSPLKKKLTYSTKLEHSNKQLKTNHPQPITYASSTLCRINLKTQLYCYG